MVVPLGGIAALRDGEAKPGGLDWLPRVLVTNIGPMKGHSRVNLRKQVSKW